MQYKVRSTFWRGVIAGVCLLMTSLPAHAVPRDDVLIIVNDNSVDSPQVATYYAQQRNINPANIVHIKVPDSYFISWDDFRRLRDQLIRFMQLNTLDGPTLTPAECVDGEPPYYCQASMDQLRAHTRIRYLVTTRGVPTRMTVDGSTLYSANAPTSVDNYLKYWLINYFTDDVQLKFTEREIAFGDGRGMRMVQPATDRELIVGRIDGLDLNAATALVDRAMAVEGAGIYGTWFGSSKFWSWKNANTGNAIYPKSGRSVLGWRYALGLWGEDRAECTDYLNFSGFLAEGKAPAHCVVQFNDDSDPALQSSLGINYPAPGNTGSRMPLVVNALGYQGWQDGQATLGSFDTLLNWRKNDQCTVTLCDNAVDPAACRANSSDIFGELNTDCVGVADGFMAYNQQSWPMSYLAIWPTGWFQSDRIGNSGWNDGGHGDLNQLAFPEVSNNEGFDDNYSLWFRNTDQVASPLCYAGSDFSVLPSVLCTDQHRLVLSQKITLVPQTLDTINPQTYRVALHYKTLNIDNNVDLRVRLFIHETGAGDSLIDYDVKTLALLTSVDSTGWTAAEVLFTLDPLLHSVSSYDGIKITIDTPNAFAGDLGIDVVSVQEASAAEELSINGSFSQGHRQAATGDHAATFLNRLSGVAAWGSVSHHQSAGSAFAVNGLESMIYFLRGLPLGDAVWFNESQNSGMLYADPLYSPVAVRLNPVNNTDLLSSSTLRLPVDFFGSTVNGRDPTMVNTSYSVDICSGNDFYACDQAQSWQTTGISGVGGSENTLLGSLDTSLLLAGQYTLRLQVTSQNIATGRSQTINDYYVVAVNDHPVAIDGNLKTLINIDGFGILTASGVDNATLTFSIVSNPGKGFVIITNSTTGAYRYIPNPGVTGVDSFTFMVNGGDIDSNIATISVNVALTNDPPVAINTIFNTNEDTAGGGTLSASDVDADPLTYNIVNNALKGSVQITNGNTGAYSYTPNASVNGTDSFTFKVNDGLSYSNIATVSVNIIAVNDAPAALASNLNTDENIVVNGVLMANDSDGDGLTYSIINNASKGLAVITNAATGAYSYTPNANATGVDSFSFKVNDGLLDSNIATVSVSITAVNDVTAPDSNGDGITDVDAIALGLDPNDPDGDTDKDGLSDVIEVGGDIGNPLDSDGDGVIDALEPGSSATDAATASGVEMNSGTIVSLTNTSGETLSAVSTESVTNGSNGFNFPYGALNFTASIPTGEVRITIRLSFSVDLPADIAIFKTDSNGNVVGEVPNQDWIRLDKRNIDLTLTDGGPFDQDGLVDGKIVDPLALGVSTTPPTDGDGSSRSGGMVDLWLLLMLGFLGMLRHRALHYSE